MTSEVSLQELSMFKGTPVYVSKDGVLDFGLRVPAVRSAQDRIVRINGQFEDRLDLVSAAYQGDSQLWWVIADLSGIIDPLAEIVAGSDLRFNPQALSVNT
jgi:hypothetical protein